MKTKSKAKAGLLRPLFATLKACPSRESRITEKRFIESWGAFRQISLEQGDTVTPAVMAGVILHDDESFASLLNDQERAQLAALARVALERYEEQTHPPNKLGKTLAASLKEKT